MNRTVTVKVWMIVAAVLVAIAGMGIAGSASSSQKDKDRIAALEAQVANGTQVGSGVVTTEAVVPVTSPPVTDAPTTTVPEQPVEVARFTGGSDKTTQSFAVRGQWKISWTVNGGAGVGIEVDDDTGRKIDYFSTDPGSEETILRTSCTCYLKLSAFGSTYTIVVTDLPG